MKARHLGSPAWIILGMTPLATQRAEAGPLPMDQLMVWLTETETKLALVDSTITGLESQIMVVEKTVVKLTMAVRDGQTPDSAMDGDNAGGFELIGRAGKSSDPSIEVELRKARTRLAEMRLSLSRAIRERRVLLNDMEMIRIQIAAWEEMEGIEAEHP